jgi:hypothetical protein
MIFAMILQIELHSEINMNFSKEEGLSSFGMSTVKVVVNVTRVLPMVQEYSTTSNRSSPRI